MRGPPARRYVQILVPLAVGAALIVPLALSGGSPSAGPSTPASGLVAPTSGPLPSVGGPTLLGGAFGPADYDGKVVVVNVWNPDCPPCTREAPALEAAWERLQGTGIAFVGVMYVGGSWPDDREAARAFLSRYGITYPVVVDEGSRITGALAIPGIPVTYVADTTGQLRYRIVGAVGPGQLEALVASITPTG